MLMRFAAVVFSLLVAPVACAQGMIERYQAGTHYYVIQPPQPGNSDGKIDVVEAFSYGCIHCAQFQPMIDKWQQTMPPEASFHYLPATFRPDFALLARAYYAAEALGAVERTHQPLFNAIFVERKTFATIEDLADWYAGHGVKRDDFLAAAKSFAVETKLARAGKQIQSYGVDGTPSVIVAGKYRVTGASAQGYDKVFDVVNFLVAKETAAAKIAIAPAS